MNRGLGGVTIAVDACDLHARTAFAVELYGLTVNTKNTKNTKGIT